VIPSTEWRTADQSVTFAPDAAWRLRDRKNGHTTPAIPGGVGLLPVRLAAREVSRLRLRPSARGSGRRAWREAAGWKGVVSSGFPRNVKRQDATPVCGREGVMTEEGVKERVQRVAVLIRWGDESHLGRLLHGEIRLVPPEFYRRKFEHASGDVNESCSWSYRRDRDPFPPKIVIAGREVPGKDLTAFTLRGTGERDRYLHCWSIISIPEDSQQLDLMRSDLARLREEFGSSYLAMPHTQIDAFAALLSERLGVQVDPRIVTYSADLRDWRPTCKSERYRYQREFRFLAGECEEHDTAPIVADVGDLSAYLSLNPSIKLSYEGTTLLEITRASIL